MVVVMEVSASEEQIETVIETMIEFGFNPSRTTGVDQTMIAGVGHGYVDLASFLAMDGVQDAFRISSPYPRGSRSAQPGGTQFRIGTAEAGGNRLLMMVRPCQITSSEQIDELCRTAARLGAKGVVAGAIRSSRLRSGFETAGEQALVWLRAAADRHKLFVVSEVTGPANLPSLLDNCDALEVSAAQMQNYGLLAELGSHSKPIILERNLSATIEDLLLSAEAILAAGNPNVLLCERGIRTFDNSMVNTMDISAIPLVHKLSHLPIIADPARATGRKDKVLPMARAAVAAGADGLIVEVDADAGVQSLSYTQYEAFTREIGLIARAVGRET